VTNKGGMMRARILYRQNREVSIIYEHLTRKPRGNETLEDVFDIVQAKWEKVRGLSNTPYEDVDESQLPLRGTERDKWRGEKGKGIHVDHSVETEREKIDKRKAEIDTLLNKPSGSVEDLKRALILMREEV